MHCGFCLTWIPDEERYCKSCAVIFKDSMPKEYTKEEKLAQLEDYLRKCIQEMWEIQEEIADTQKEIEELRTK